MRYILALSLLVSLCASANAATKHRRQAPVPHDQKSFSSSPPSSARAHKPPAPPVYYQPRGDSPYQNWGG
jgi:hypothetical protein